MPAAGPGVIQHPAQGWFLFYGHDESRSHASAGRRAIAAGSLDLYGVIQCIKMTMFGFPNKQCGIAFGKPNIFRGESGRRAG
jgi:hypothetical protein